MIKVAIILSLICLAINSYSPPLALEMMYMAEIAYESQNAIDSWSCTYCRKFKFAHAKSFYSSKSSTQGFTGFLEDHSAIVISFRGSTNVQNWITNLDAITTSYPMCSGCQIHSGFYSAYRDVTATVNTQLQQLLSLYRSAKIYVTGHSLGGALAVICALEIKNIYGKVDNLITMGQPRVGNTNFASYLTSRIGNTFRVINYADTVVHAPPSAFSFKHGGHQIWYNPRGMQSYRDCTSEDPTCANSIATSSFSISDHSLDNYLRIKTSYSWSQWLQETIKSHLRKQSQYTAEQLSQYELNNLNRIIANLEAKKE